MVPCCELHAKFHLSRDIGSASGAAILLRRQIQGKRHHAVVLHIRVPDDSVADGRIEPVDAPLKIGDPVATRDALNETLKFRCAEKK